MAWAVPEIWGRASDISWPHSLVRDRPYASLLTCSSPSCQGLEARFWVGPGCEQGLTMGSGIWGGCGSRGQAVSPVLGCMGGLSCYRLLVCIRGSVKVALTHARTGVEVLASALTGERMQDAGKDCGTLIGPRPACTDIYGAAITRRIVRAGR